MKLLFSTCAVLAFALGQLPAADSTTLQGAGSDRASARPELVVTTLGFGSCVHQDRPATLSGEGWRPRHDPIEAARAALAS